MSLQAHKPSQGIALALLAGFFVTCMNLFAKLSGDIYSPTEIVFYRGLIALVLLFGFLSIKADFSVLKTKNPRIHIIRSLIGTLSVVVVFWSFTLMPMANATSLLMLSGLLVTALSAPFLGEKIGPIRWTAVLLGFVGAFIIIQPDSSTFMRAEALVPLFGALTVAAVALILRKMSHSEKPLTTVTYFMITSTVLCGLYMFCFKDVSLPQHYFFYVILVGVFSMGQQLAKTYANQFADASLLSPYVYVTLIWSILFDILIWNTWPNMSVWLGSIIIIGSNMIVFWREREKSKKRPRK